MSDLSSNLCEAWKARAADALRDAAYAEAAPALFKPEWKERAAIEYRDAVTKAAYWRGVGGS